MRKYTISFYAIWLICLLTPINLLAQDLTSSPDSLVDTEQVVNLEYEIYCTSDLSAKYKAVIQLAELYTSAGRYHKAIIELKTINPAGDSNSYNYKKAFNLSQNYYLAGILDSALQYIDSLKTHFPDSANTQKVVLLNLIVLIDLYKWEESEKLLSNYYTLQGRELLSDTNYTCIEKPKLKSLKKTVLLSRLPGGGFFYVNENRKAATSIILITAGVAYTAVSVYTGYYFTAVLTGFSNSLKFYQGGKKASVFYCKQSNEKKMRVVSDKLKVYCIENL